MISLSGLSEQAGMHSTQMRESLHISDPIAGSSTEARRTAQPLPTEEAIYRDISSNIQDKHGVCIQCHIMLVLRYAAFRVCLEVTG